MTNKAIFFSIKNTGCDLQPLMESCRNEQFEVEDRGPVPDHKEIKTMLPRTPCAIFVPAIEEDCIGIKLAQDALEEKLPRIIVLYAPSMPSKEYLCLAFREGVDEIIAMDDGAERLAVKVTRVGRMLRAKMGSAETGGQLQRKVTAMQILCEQLECKNARWRQRLLALSSTSVRLATGRLQFAESAPSLFIAAASQTQANIAAELAGQLGFTTQIARTGKDALDRIKEFSPQVILTDGTLPDMDAKTFALAARKTLGSKPAIIIAWSSNPETEETLLDTDTGIDDFVLKSTTNEGAEMLAAALLGGVA